MRRWNIWDCVWVSYPQFFAVLTVLESVLLAIDLELLVRIYRNENLRSHLSIDRQRVLEPLPNSVQHRSFAQSTEVQKIFMTLKSRIINLNCIYLFYFKSTRNILRNKQFIASNLNRFTIINVFDVFSWSPAKNRMVFNPECLLTHLIRQLKNI